MCRGSCALTHTFGCIVYTPEGIKSVRSYGKAVVGLNVGTGSRRYPRSFLYVHSLLNARAKLRKRIGIDKENGEKMKKEGEGAEGDRHQG